MSADRSMRRQLARDNAKLSVTLREIPRQEWPRRNLPPNLLRVWRSRDFLVQEFPAFDPAMVRLSVNRTVTDGNRWQDNIAWDDLQRLKRECGYGDRDAIEIFPADVDTVNVANMRHLWILKDPHPLTWRITA